MAKNFKWGQWVVATEDCGDELKRGQKGICLGVVDDYYIWVVTESNVSAHRWNSSWWTPLTKKKGRCKNEKRNKNS